MPSSTIFYTCIINKMKTMHSTILGMSISAVILFTILVFMFPPRDMHDDKLECMHAKLQIKYGSFGDEYNEQRMAVKYITENRKVLEIGGNIGRNSLVIASILKDSSNLVVLESDENTARKLEENRDLNNLSFHVESSALSNRKLIQKGWDTIPSETLLDGYTWVKTISLPDLKTKYNINYDTLVIDCEGAFYYILKDMPEILDNISLIIMENDYNDYAHKSYVDGVLIDQGFRRVYGKMGGSIFKPCYKYFFETWSKCI